MSETADSFAASVLGNEGVRWYVGYARQLYPTAVHGFPRNPYMHLSFYSEGLRLCVMVNVYLGVVSERDVEPIVELLLRRVALELELCNEANACLC
jgi:hypothetical protein